MLINLPYRVDYDVLKTAVKTLGWGELPDAYEEAKMDTEEFTKPLHDVLLGKEILVGKLKFNKDFEELAEKATSLYIS